MKKIYYEFMKYFTIWVNCDDEYGNGILSDEIKISSYPWNIK